MNVTALVLLFAPSAFAAVNCGQVLLEAKIPSCIALEQVTSFGCKNDPFVPKGQRWAGKSQTKEAQKATAKDAQECLQTFSMTFSRDACCRREMPKAPPKKKMVQGPAIPLKNGKVATPAPSQNKGKAKARARP